MPLLLKMIVQFVDINVLNVLCLLTTVSFVLLTDSVFQIVIAQLVIMTSKVFQLVKLVQLNVNIVLMPPLVLVVIQVSSYKELLVSLPVHQDNILLDLILNVLIHVMIVMTVV